MKLSKQEKRVLNIINSMGFINPIISWSRCGVYRLSDVILRLRKKGYPIITKRMNTLNQFNEPVSFAHYYLEEK